MANSRAISEAGHELYRVLVRVHRAAAWLAAVFLCAALTQCKAGTNSAYWAYAQLTHNCVTGNFLTAFRSYRIEPKSTTAYEWYCVSQMYADSAMVLNGDTRYVSYMNNAYGWMSNLWDSGSSAGGYFSAANVSGKGAGAGKYVDDNSLTGNVYLDCYAVSTGTARTNYLNAAMAAANWLMFSGQWDSTFGGGFWWDLTKTNKPTQSNGLAMQLFLRLYQITGQTYYRDWADSVRTWLDAQMYNSADGLYVWQITTNGTAAGSKNMMEFTYDNGIMIEANLLYYQVMTNSIYRTKAQNLANSLNAKLWNNTYGGYYLDT